MDEYKSTAKFYDALLFVFVRTIRNKVIDIIRQHRYNSILDVCCGTGDQLKLLKKQNIDGEGIDISNDMLKVAKSGYIKANCRYQDAADTDYRDEYFDLVMTAFALHEKNHTTARSIVEEMVRISSKDILIVDYELNEKTSIVSKWLIYAIERLAGGEHYSNFRSYILTGGLERLLLNIELIEIEKYYFGNGGIVLLLLRKNIRS